MNNKSISIPTGMVTKKFYCHECGERLVKNPKVRTIKPGDPDYKKHSRIGRTRIIGDIELTEYDFKCPSCEKLISYDEQCVIGEIQKNVGMHVLSQDNINENYEKANTTLQRKRKIGAIIGKTFVIAVIILAICYLVKSGDLSFKIRINF